GLVTRHHLREVVEARDRRGLCDNVTNSRPRLLIDPLREGSAVGVRVDGNDAVLANIAERHPEKGCDGRLANTALAGEDRHETGAALELLIDASLKRLAGTN